VRRDGGPPHIRASLPSGGKNVNFQGVGRKVKRVKTAEVGGESSLPVSGFGGKVSLGAQHPNTRDVSYILIELTFTHSATSYCALRKNMSSTASIHDSEVED